MAIISESNNKVYRGYTSSQFRYASIYVVITFVLRLGLQSSDLNLLTALVVALFLAIPYWKGKYFSNRKKGGLLHAGH